MGQPAPTHWVVIPTGEADHNWIPWIIVGHNDPNMIRVQVPPVDAMVTGADGNTYTGHGTVDAHSKAWRAGWDAAHPGDYPDEQAAHHEFAEYLRSHGYTVHIGEMLWVDGVLS